MVAEKSINIYLSEISLYWTSFETEVDRSGCYVIAIMRLLIINVINKIRQDQQRLRNLINDIRKSIAIPRVISSYVG